MLGRSFFYAGGPSVCHIPLFYAAGCFSLCCTGLARLLLGFGARSNPYPDPWEDPKVELRWLETLCGASYYAARFWGLY